MFAMLEAKLPPPKPAVPAATRKSQYGVPGCETQTARSVHGRKRSSALTTVQLRPPKRPGANVYGKRIVAPTSPGIEISQKSCEVVKVKPAPLSFTETTLQSCQIEKPR